jgi:hypothetical protein
MSSYIVQDDYGGFDTRFIGITLRMWPKTWEILDNFMSPDRDPKEVLSIGNEALDRGTEQAFETFSIGTVLTHELRHFHDFMLSPFGNRILRLRVLAAINGSQIIGRILNKEREIPVPLTKWKRLSNTEQTRLTTEWEELLGRSVNFRFTPDDTNFSEVEKAYNRIKDLVIGHQNSTPMPYSPAHIFEASAIAVQIVNVFNVFGIAHADLFSNYLLSNAALQQYTFAVRVWQGLSNISGTNFDINLLSAAVVWSILGNYEIDGWNACPTYRFARLFSMLRNEGLPTNDPSVPYLFDYWSQRLRTCPIAKAINDTTARNEKLIERLRALPSEYQDISVGTGPVISAFEYYCQARQLLISHFIESPEAYVLPHLYSDLIYKLPAAPIRLDFPHHFLVGPKDILDTQYNVRMAQQMKNGKWAVRRALLKAGTAGIEVIPIDVAADANDFLTMVDFVFSEFRRDDPDFDLSRQGFTDDGIVPLEILN